VGHNWHALEVTWTFPSIMEVSGVEMDYTGNSYNAFTSVDGITWEEVITGGVGGQSFLSAQIVRFARLRWEETDGSNGIHAHFLGAAASGDVAEAMEAAAAAAATTGASAPHVGLDDAAISSSTQTGWGRDAAVIQYGQTGLVGHNWHALEVTWTFPSIMEVSGVEMDYTGNSYNAFTSVDGITWEEVITGGLGGQSFLSAQIVRFARLRWEETDGSNGIHAHFLGATASGDAAEAAEAAAAAAAAAVEAAEAAAAAAFGAMGCDTVDATSITSSTQTGWGRDAAVIQYGQTGLVGHNWNALEVTFEFPSTMAFCGVEMDYADNTYNALTSMDGSTWEEVLTGVSGEQSFPAGTTARFARLRWEDTHGSQGIHVLFRGGAPSQ